MADEPALRIYIQQRVHAAVPLRTRIVTKPFECDLAHAGHDPQTQHDVFGIGDLETDLGQRRIRRAHNVGNDEHRAPAHRALKQSFKFRIGLGWVSPVVGWPGFLFRWCADKSELLDTSDIVRIRPMKIRVRDFLLFSSIRTFCLSDSAIRNSFSRSEPSHQKMFSGCVSAAISCTQSSTALLEGFLSPMPLGGNMAGARFFIERNWPF